jgi:antitoxin component YwqK of YwqJK toxin-antitoxin module
MIEYYKNGQKSYEGTYKGGELISEKYWNEDGSLWE